ncbi:threonine aldolase [Virgibacillus halotolerans]|uniref:hypothetical protein n=1 Tax=Virgibacillus halotolerans TaxID=1071053 RepID=UPI001960B542|nr:hypothetical protein [Virgibacillus halotolerans]MBM7599100.1 threonine aldolase [Virgibacillus halotolerans]
MSIEVVKEGWNADQLIEKLKANDVYVKKIGLKKVRMVTHYQVSRQDIDKVLKQFQFILG